LPNSFEADAVSDHGSKQHAKKNLYRYDDGNRRPRAGWCKPRRCRRDAVRKDIRIITIEITNPEAILKQHTGWFTGLAGSVVARLGMMDLAEKVQETIVQRLTEELGPENARISVSGRSE